jgi:phage terminase large subunit-like protein
MTADPWRGLLDSPRSEVRKFLRRLPGPEAKALGTAWKYQARPEQLPPPGDWHRWLVCAGRGFGKTRLGAEWVGAVARVTPRARIALVGATIGEARAVMVEGESGLLACGPRHKRPRFEASLRRLTWANGAQATLYSAGEPEGLRGPQHSHAYRAVAQGTLCQRSLCSR